MDVNCGCPIDLVNKKGAGCALLTKPQRLFDITESMSKVLKVPLTVKVRMGTAWGSSNPVNSQCGGDRWPGLVAHRLIPRMPQYGITAVTVHGRTQKQRYSKAADWSYVGACVEAATSLRWSGDGDNDDVHRRFPVIGSGDCMSWTDYHTNRSQSGVDTVMLARGVLVKPWLCTEIKQRRHWDISATERLDIVKSFCEMGLEHWGSDSRGVAMTRM